MEPTIPTNNVPPQGVRRPKRSRIVRQTTVETGSTSTTATAAGTTEATPVKKLIDFLKNVDKLNCSLVVSGIIASILMISIYTTDILHFLSTKDKLIEQTNRDIHYVFTLNSLVISEIQASPAQLTGKCYVLLNMTNLSDRTMYQENSIMSVFFRHELLWVVRTGDLFLDGHETTTFDVSMNTTTISVPASYVTAALLESRKSSRPLYFKVKYDGLLREGLGSWDEDKVHVYMVCGWIHMQFVNESALKGGQSKCYIEHY